MNKRLSNYKLLLILLFTISSVQTQAARWGFAKKYEILPLSQSHESIGVASQTHLNPKSIKVLVWNVLKGERRMWSKDFKKLSANKDILLLQEGYLNTQMRDTLYSMDDFQFDMGVSFIYRKDNNTKTGSFIGSRVKPLEVYFTRTTDLEPLIKTPKTTTYAYYPISNSNKTLLALSIHGINFADHQAFVNHIDQSINLIKNHDGPIIFGGDFNTRTKKRTSHLRNLLRRLGLKEASFRNDKRMRAVKVGPVLDHVFIRDLLIRDSEVLGKIKSSDHKAMVLDLVMD